MGDVSTLPVVTMGVQPPSFLVVAAPDINGFSDYLSLARDFLACYSAVKSDGGLPFAEQNHPTLTCALFDKRGIPAQLVLTADGNLGCLVLKADAGTRYLRDYLTTRGISFRERLDHADMVLPSMTIDGLAMKCRAERKVNRKNRPMMEHVNGLVKMLDAQTKRTSHEADLESTDVVSVVGNEIRTVMCTETGCDLDSFTAVESESFKSYGTVNRCNDCGQHFTPSDLVQILETPPEPVAVSEEE